MGIKTIGLVQTYFHFSKLFQIIHTLLIYIAFSYIINPEMRVPIVACLISLSIICVFAAGSQTKITFFVEHQVEPKQDFIEIVLTIKSEDTSLKQALVQAEETVKFARNQIEQYCKTNSKKKSQCHQITQNGKFNAQPLYRLIRKQPVFIAFSVSYEVTGKILQTQNVGQLVDKLNRRQGIQIQELQWKAFEETDDQIETIGEGIEEAQRRCKNIGMSLGTFDSINEVADFELEQEAGDEQQQEEEQQQDQTEVIVYKFVVTCVGKPSKKK